MDTNSVLVSLLAMSLVRHRLLPQGLGSVGAGDTFFAVQLEAAEKKG